MKYQVQFVSALCGVLLLFSGGRFLSGHPQVTAETAACGNLGASLNVGLPYVIAGRAVGFAAGDFNQDGKPDLALPATGAGDAASVMIMLGDGRGYLETIAKIPLEGSLSSVVTGDLNRDGKLDLVVSGVRVGNTNGIASLLGNGDGTFRLVSTSVTGAGASTLALADFDGDSQPDIAVTNQFVSGLAVLHGQGNGVFGQAAIYNVGVSADAIGVADFNSDGKLDLAVSGRLLLNNGTGGFNLVNASFSGSGLAVGDLNGDGKTDVVAAQFNFIAVYLGDGRGGFGTPKNFGNRVSGATLMRDFNGDNRLDVAFANNNSATGSVVIMLGNGLGEFGAATEYAGGKLPYALEAADFNSDGKLDLTVLNLDAGNEGATQFSLLFGNGLGDFQAPFVASGGSFPTAVTSGDLNKDGRPDLIIPNRSLAGVTVALNNGQGKFGAPTRLDTTYGIDEEATAAVVHDFNRDGNPDLAVANNARFASPAGQVTVLFGRGDGTFDRSRTRTFGVGDRAADLVAADFNGDGAPDLATANYASNDVSIVLNNGNGEFGAARNLPVGLDPRSLVAGDFNADNKLDLAVANRNTATLTIMLGNGDGTFNSMPLGIGANPRTVKAGDVNSDGKLDLIVLHNNDHAVSVLLGNGGGTFGPPLNSSLGRLPFAMAVNDFNGDGKLDVAVTVILESEFTVDKVFVFVGDGAGKFNATTNFTMPPPTFLTTNDFNGDGQADLLVLTASQGGNAATWVVVGQCNTAGANTMINASAASYRRLNLASGMIVAAFGRGLSPGTASATTTPLPTQLAGTSVSVRDSAGSERLAALFFVSPGQINYQIPVGTVSGSATIIVNNSGTAVATDSVLITPVAPGLFTANANGQGVPAGVALRVKPNGGQSFEPLAQFDATQNQFVPVAIDVYGVFPPNINDQVFLILFGTGIRGRSAQANVQAYVGGVEVPVQFAAAQGQLVGVDQVNLLLPKTLVLRGELEVLLTVDGKLANEVKITIQ